MSIPCVSVLFRVVHTTKVVTNLVTKTAQKSLKYFLKKKKPEPVVTRGTGFLGDGDSPATESHLHIAHPTGVGGAKLFYEENRNNNTFTRCHLCTPAPCKCLSLRVDYSTCKLQLEFASTQDFFRMESFSAKFAQITTKLNRAWHKTL